MVVLSSQNLLLHLFLQTWKTTNCRLKKLIFQRQSVILLFIKFKHEALNILFLISQMLHVFIILNLRSQLLFHTRKALHSSFIIG